MYNSLLSRVSGWSFTAFACAAATLSVARAQTAAPAEAFPVPTGHELVRLDGFVVSASRTPQDLKYTPSAVSVLLPTELALSQITDLHTALSAEPGVIVVNTGAKGGQSSVFLRGADSHQTLFVVDGVRMNDKSAGYQNFLGQSGLGGIDRMEVLRGPQSTLYGSSAMGGVITISTTRGCGAPTGSVSAEAGSFNTVGGAASVQGGTKTLGYSGYISREVTDNDRPSNNSKVMSFSTRVEYTPTENTLLGGTFRGQDGDTQDPGAIGNTSGTVEAKNWLGTAYGQIHFGPEIISRLTAGWHQRDYTYTKAPSVSKILNTRNILDWQNVWSPASEAEIIAGANYEGSHYVTGGLRTNDTVKAGFFSATYHPVEALTLTGGGRYDDYRSAGSATTWRTGISWVPAKGSKLRATYGTGFGAPSLTDRYGVLAWGQMANPSLRPEKSRGWDVGFDQEIFGKALKVGVTYFHNRFTDLFQWQATGLFVGMTSNVGRATTQGVELELNSKVNDFVSTRLAYTYLDATDDLTGNRLQRRPRHTVDGEVRFQATAAWIVGTGVHVAADRENVNYAVYPSPQIDVEDYTTARVFTSYELTKNLRLKARVENALDESYADVLGYPALPRAVYGSVEWKF